MGTHRPYKTVPKVRFLHGLYDRVAQLGERYGDIVEAMGSSPILITCFVLILRQDTRHSGSDTASIS